MLSLFLLFFDCSFYVNQEILGNELEKRISRQECQATSSKSGLPGKNARQQSGKAGCQAKMPGNELKKRIARQECQATS
ncbi:hypothetical protein [Metabacillus sp. FJAT-52054]|uniref:Secreted protein n=1 Tax=Metabacillus sediminis TaxID=3117746 RepID=A0ABZ2ND98_9BACI